MAGWPTFLSASAGTNPNTRAGPDAAKVGVGLSSGMVTGEAALVLAHGHRALGSGLWCTTIACTPAALVNKHSPQKGSTAHVADLVGVGVGVGGVVPDEQLDAFVSINVQFVSCNTLQV